MHSSPMTRRLLVTTGAVAVLLAGCSNDGDGTEPGPVDTREQAPTTVASTVPGATGSGGDQPSNEIPDANTPNGGAGVGSNDEWNSETDSSDLAD